MAWHERLGIILLVIFAIHLILNYKWVKAVSRNILNKKMTKKQINSYIVFIILTISALVAVVSGVLVSVTMLHSISFANRAIMVIIHRLSALILFISIIVHIGMHGKYIMRIFKLKKS